MKTGIIGAMEEEIERLTAGLEDVQEARVGAFVFYEGGLEGQPVVVVRSGVGKVNAAVTTLLLLQREVGRVIFVGVAGALEPALNVGDVVVSTDAVQHDVDVTALGYAPGEVPGELPAWEADESLREAALAAAAELDGVGVMAGRVVSGDQFIASADKAAALRAQYGAVCAEMEGASAAQVCAKWGVPFVIVRSISDTADGAAKVDFRTFTPLAAERAERVVRTMLRRL